MLLTAEKKLLLDSILQAANRSALNHFTLHNYKDFSLLVFALASKEKSNNTRAMYGDTRRTNMTIDEKRRKINEYCDLMEDCGDCLLYKAFGNNYECEENVERAYESIILCMMLCSNLNIKGDMMK